MEPAPQKEDEARDFFITSLTIGPCDAFSFYKGKPPIK